jgi:hypothetical protein
MTAHQDVAGLVTELRDSHDGVSGDVFCVPSEVADRAADRLESLSQALREAEAELDRNARNRDMWKGQCERQADELVRLRDAIRIKGGDEHSPTWDAYVAACRAIDKHRERSTTAITLLRRYRDETPLGNQPHMIAHEVDAFIAGNGGKDAE